VPEEMVLATFLPTLVRTRIPPAPAVFDECVIDVSAI
jgi:hypothetical protein